nr:response regulator [Micromonospora sp. DSM 115978]
RILREAGYQVLPATDGRQSMEIAATSPSFDVLVTDVVMPGMNGQQLADHVRSRAPELPVVFMSAYTRGALTAGVAEPGTSYLDKPFTAATLTEAIRSVLAARAAVAPAALG